MVIPPTLEIRRFSKAPVVVLSANYLRQGAAELYKSRHHRFCAQACGPVVFLQRVLIKHAAKKK